MSRSISSPQGSLLEHPAHPVSPWPTSDSVGMTPTMLEKVKVTEGHMLGEGGVAAGGVTDALIGM